MGGATKRLWGDSGWSGPFAAEKIEETVGVVRLDAGRYTLVASPSVCVMTPRGAVRISDLVPGDDAVFTIVGLSPVENVSEVSGASGCVGISFSGTGTIESSIVSRDDKYVTPSGFSDASKLVSGDSVAVANGGFGRVFSVRDASGDPASVVVSIDRSNRHVYANGVLVEIP